jgi:hypothetical protein
MSYIDVEQLYCKFAASNDVLSQGLCYVQFEQKFPPAQWQAINIAGDSALVPVAFLIFVIWIAFQSVRDGGWMGAWGRRQLKPTPRHEPKL